MAVNIIDDNKQDEQIIEKMKNLVVGEEGMIVIFHSNEDVVICSKGIDKRDIGLVLSQAYDVAME